MEIYLLAYVSYFSILSVGLSRKNARPWIIVASLPMFALVWLRGNVGVDLPMYVQSIELIQLAGEYTFLFEPGFEFLILALGSFASDPITVAKLLATITSVLLLFGKWRAKMSYQVIGLGIIPYFYLDMTMNGLRYGLAFAITLISLKSLLKRQRLRYTLFTLGAASMQISTLYVGGVLQTLLRPSYKQTIAILSIVATIALIGLEYVSLKAAANSELFKPGITAGIAPLLLSLIVLIGCWRDKLIRENNHKAILTLLALTMVTYGITQFTYAGLRLQQLNYFLILVFLILVGELKEKRLSRHVLISLILVSVLGSIFRLNNFSADADVGEAPFVPYKFFWQE